MGQVEALRLELAIGRLDRFREASRIDEDSALAIIEQQIRVVRVSVPAVAQNERAPAEQSNFARTRQVPIERS